eukprot:13790845-Heterocapsa_arctica.AAC.1
MSKGRSPSSMLNGHCRKGCAIELAGRFGVFDFWVPTEGNPADKPSRVHSFSAKSRLPQPPPLSTVV